MSADPETHFNAEALVAPTWECNLKCRYCFVREQNVMKQESFMSPELAVRVMDALDEGLSEARSIRVHLYGGEPFLNLPAAEAMVKRALEKPGRFRFIATTNGTVLSDALIDVLEAGKFIVILSIDGPAEIHDECRRKKDGSPTHKDVIRFLETVRARTSCHIEGASVIRSGSRLLHASRYLRTLPIHTIKAQLVRSATGTPYSLTREERELYKQDLEAIGNTVIEELEAGKVPMDNRFDNRVLRLLIKGNDQVDFCDAGRHSFGITPSGNVLSCLLVEDDDAVLGHVNDDPKIWREAGRKWRARPLRKKCISCSDLQLCGGGCSAIVPVCGDEECDIIAKNCDVARHIYEHFHDNQEALLALAGII